MKEVEIQSRHIALFNDMVKVADVLWCEANTFNNEIISELIQHTENLSPENFKNKVCEVFCGTDYSEDYGEGYHKFIRYVFDYALRFVLSERVKKQHLNEPDKLRVETY